MPASLEHSEDLFDVSTPSVSSTVSSSGDVEGVYTLYSDEMTQSSEDEEEIPDKCTFVYVYVPFLTGYSASCCAKL